MVERDDMGFTPTGADIGAGTLAITAGNISVDQATTPISRDSSYNIFYENIDLSLVDSSTLNAIKLELDEVGPDTGSGSVNMIYIDVTCLSTHTPLVRRGVYVKMDGTSTANAATSAFYYDCNMTINAASGSIRGAWIDFDGVVVTSAGIVYGIHVDISGITTPANATQFAGVYIEVPSTYDAIRFDAAAVTKIGTDNIAGITKQIQFDIPITAGGAANATLGWEFLIDGVLLAGLIAETSGGGSYQNPVFQLPYQGQEGHVAPTLPTGATNGAVKVEYDTGGGADSTRLYINTAGGLHYITSDGGFSMPEMECGLTGEKWKMGDFFIAQVDQLTDSMHGIPVKLEAALEATELVKGLRAEIGKLEARIEELECA